MNGRAVLYGLLLIVAGAAAVLSFAALRDLALLCGFGPRLAWLLPVVVDAGAAAGSLVWLGGDVASAARRFARALALGLLALSVAANALGHGLAAFSVAPAWWVVVAVSAVAPAVLGAVVHLAVLVGRPDPDPHPGGWVVDSETSTPAVDSSRTADRDAGPEVGAATGQDVEPGPMVPVALPGIDVEPTSADGRTDDRAAELIAAGAGRRRVARELGLTEYEARRLLERARGHGSGPTTTADGRVALPVNGVPR